ncbi:MAG: insulinase family protein [Ferruginibacter sp.]|nr:insulinase family protein [Ferruginibacter sp.]
MRLKFYSLLFISGFSLSSATAQPKLIEKVVQKGKEVVIPYEKYVLPNGLTVVIHEDHSDPIVHVDVTYHVGSAREEIGKSGFAHFFEHMMFQGSDNVGDEQHFKIISEAGGTLNGTTNRDRTNYFETVPNNQIEKMLWLEADRMGFLLDAVTQQKFEVQRETVKNERGQNYDNRPYGLVYEVSSKNLYPYGHPYSWLTIGYLEDLNRSDVNDLKNFFLRWYGPNNATLTIGGDIVTADVLKMVEKYFGSIPRGPEVKPTVLKPVKLESNRYVSYVDNYARTPLLRIVYPTVPSFDADEPALDCLADIIGGGKNSIFYQELVKPRKAAQASANSSMSELAGEFSITVAPFPGKSLAEMEELINAAMEKFDKRGVTDEDIERYRGGIESITINGLASVSGKVSKLAYFQTFQNNPNLIGDMLKRNISVTKEDVWRVYEKYIKGKNRLVVSAVPKEKEDLVAGKDNYTVSTAGYKAPDYGYKGLVYNKAKDNFDRSKMPAAGKNPVVNVPPFWQKNLTNGMQVIGTENTEIPTVNISVSLKGGRLMENNELTKAGLTSIVASMLNEDTKKYSSEDFSTELEKLGSSISVYNTTDAIVFSMQSLVRNMDKTIALFEERILNPVFNEDDFIRIKAQQIERIKNNSKSASSVASNVYAALNYGDNQIFGLPGTGTLATVENINLDDVINYYGQYFSSDEGKVIVVGDVKEAQVLPKLSFLNKLPNKKFTLPIINSFVPVNKTKIYLVDIPNAAQTEFRIGGANNLRYDATGEYYRAYLTNFNLGAAFNSRLNINLREDKGWTYGARSGFSADKYSGAFTFSSGIKRVATDSAVAEIMGEINNYVDNGITQEEVDFMRASIGQSDARNYETPGQKSSFIGRILQYNLPADFVSQQTKILNNIQTQDIDNTAKKLIDTKKMNIVLVGDKASILPGLRDLGYEIVELDANGKSL